MDKQGKEEAEAARCTHDWRITDTQMSGTMCIYWAICRRCGARRETHSYTELVGPTDIGVR